MIAEYIRYQLTEHSPADLIAGYAAAAEHLRAAPECHGFELSQCDDAPESFILQIHWTSREAHLEGFRKSANFPPFLAAIRPFIGEIAEMRHYTPTAIVWAR